MSELPLKDVLVVDFSNLLPGPLATLALARVGAKVVKIERPDGGDEMREYEPRVGRSSANFALLNAGKEMMIADLKDERQLGIIKELLMGADILVEQFRPGVMERLGLGYSMLSTENPRLIYCSITGYGQSGPKRQTAGHDLNYLADSGLLSLTCGPDGEPQLPPTLIADIGGGSYPAIINILLALLLRDRTGKGMHLDVSMSDNLFPWMYWAIGKGFTTGKWPVPGSERVPGGSPRYNIYRTRDGRYLAVAALEERFWRRFCELLGISPEAADDTTEPEAVRARLTERIEDVSSGEWQRILESEDVCCNVVRTLEEAIADLHFNERGIFRGRIRQGKLELPALPIPVVPQLQDLKDEVLTDPSIPGRLID
jgi:alpha-methylacyl-CoA racemase